MDFQDMSADLLARSNFLNCLAQKNRRKIRAAVRGVQRARFDLDDAVQVFLLAANAAIDTARTEDDGRGNNDPEAWCAWRGMLAVKDAVRNTMGRQKRMTPAARDARRRMFYAHSLSQVPEEGERFFYADPNDYAD